MFDQSHYVPVLRWKAAERTAILHLTPDVKASITPLIEFVPKDFVNASLEKVVRTKAKELAETWGWERRFFVDFSLLNRELVPQAVSRFHELAREYQLQPVFVASLGCPPAQLQAFHSASKQQGSGLVLRIDTYEFRQVGFHQKLARLLASLSLTPPEVDIVLDFGIISETHASFASVLDLFPDPATWRSLIACSGAFPKDLGEMEKNRQHELPRYDWLAWEECASNGAGRVPTFGDYTIQHPRFEENEGKHRNFSASIRYASERIWVIMRGEGVHNENGPGYNQYPAQALLLSERSEFRGESFSFGDRYIKHMSREMKKTGGPKQWLAAGINHHMTLTVWQLAQRSVVANKSEFSPG